MILVNNIIIESNINTLIDLPGLKSNRLIRLVNKAIISVFTAISIIPLDITIDINRAKKKTYSSFYSTSGKISLKKKLLYGPP